MDKEKISKLIKNDYALIAILMIIKILIHLLNPEYGYHRDEMYYIAIGDGFSFYNFDMGPVAPLYLKIFTFLFGYSLKSIHFASALCGALALLFTCKMTIALGGRKYAIFLTGLCMLFSGFLIFGSLYSYDSPEFLLEVMIIYFIVRILKEDNPKLWIYIGILIGLGLMNKMTMVFVGAALFFTLWFVPGRKYFKDKWIWIAALISFLFSLPFIIWQFNHDWYFWDFAKNYAGSNSYIASFPEYLYNQIIPNNPSNLLFWLTGLIILLFSKKWKQYRYLGLIFLFLFFLYFILGVKFYFLIPFYSILFAAGSIKIEEWIWSLKGKKAGIIKYALPLTFIPLSSILLPIAIPLLPVEDFAIITKTLGPNAGVKHEYQRLNDLPQHFADRFGWEEMVKLVADAYHKIDPNEKSATGILVSNWGEAGAMHLFREKYNIPEVTCADGWFYFELMRNNNFKQNYLAFGISRYRLKSVFKDVQEVAIFRHPYCMPHENNKKLFLCKSPRYNLRQYLYVEKTIDKTFINTLRNEGVQKAILYYYDIKRKEPDCLLFTEWQINNLGYNYINNNRINDAIALFKFNVEVFPESSNVYDSLGEAYMKNGDLELAITNYKKSLEIDPNNDNAIEKLKSIQK